MSEFSSTTKREDAIFTIILDENTLLFQAGTTVSGNVYLHFHGTREDIKFDSIIIYLKENINLPEREDSKKNLTSQVFDNKVLLDQSFKLYHQYILDINQSNIAKIPFKINLPEYLASSFNSKQVTISYEIKVELLHLQLCGELCDLSTSQPIEIKENEARDLTQSTIERRIDILYKVLETKIGTLTVKINKPIFCKDDTVESEVHLQSVVTHIKTLVKIDVVQVVQLKHHSTWENIIYKTKQVLILKENKLVSFKSSIPLNEFLYNSQPSVRRSCCIEVDYKIRVALYVNNKQIALEVPFQIIRKNSLLLDYKRVLSASNVPLLPLNLTVNELKTDGLQSYIPLKQSYENKRLLVKKGDLTSANAVLTIVTSSCKPYTKNDTVKGYVYCKINDDVTGDITFKQLVVILVGARKLPHMESSSKGEMFLYERKILKGPGKQKSLDLKLSRNSGLMIIEFEFNLKKFKTEIPPSFKSNDVSISYELKADLFNLDIDNTKSSLYTTLPLVIKEDFVPQQLVSNRSNTATSNTYTLSGKQVFVSFSIDKHSYSHQDSIQITVNIKNKSKYQLTAELDLSQNIKFTNSPCIQKDVFIPIIVLILPKSKLVAKERMHLKHIQFHREPSISQYSELTVFYFLTLKLRVSSAQVSLKPLTLPIQIIRRYGHSCKSITREGYPLLPLTVEMYGGDRIFRLPSCLKDYHDKKLVHYLHSSSYGAQWKGWLLKT